MGRARFAILASCMLALTACGTRTDSSVSPTPGETPISVNAQPAALPAKSPDRVILTEGDITDRPYRSLGDVEVTVKKWTIFDKDPTREVVAQALKEKAAQMGADAVVLARFGSVGIGVWSWGQMDGQGRAVVFQK